MPKNETNLSTETSASRRDVVKAAAWVVPAVVTLTTVAPSFAGVASGQEPKDKRPQERL